MWPWRASAFAIAMMVSAGVLALHVVGEADADRLRLARADDVELARGGEARAQRRRVQDRGDRTVVAEADLRGRREQRAVGRERGQGVRLEQVDPALGGDAEIEARDIAQPERLHGIARDRAQPGRHVARHVRRAAVLDLVRLDVLEPVVVDVEALGVRLAARQVDEIDRREQALIVADALDEADDHVEPLDVLLDEHAIGIGAERALQRARELARLLDDRAAERTIVDALARALVVRLDDHREREPGAALDDGVVVAGRDEHAARGVDPAARHEQLGQPLVERDRVRVGVAAGEWNAELLEQRRIERLAHAAAIALRRVEDEIRVDRLEPVDQVRRGPRDLDLLDLVAGTLDRRCDRVHRLRAVVLGLFFGLANVGQAEVVGERDLHVDPSVAKRCDSETVKRFDPLDRPTLSPARAS